MTQKLNDIVKNTKFIRFECENFDVVTLPLETFTKFSIGRIEDGRNLELSIAYRNHKQVRHIYGDESEFARYVNFTIDLNVAKKVAPNEDAMRLNMYHDISYIVFEDENHQELYSLAISYQTNAGNDNDGQTNKLMTAADARKRIQERAKKYPHYAKQYLGDMDKLHDELKITIE